MRLRCLIPFSRFAIPALLFALPALAAAPDALLSAAGTVENRQQVISLLQENRLKYGDDAAIMQGLLLVHAIQADAILTSEVSITGFEELEGRRYVAFRVVSGAIFNDDETTRDQRLERIWHSILERTLRRYPTFRVTGDGVAVEIQYNHRPYASVTELYRTIDEEGAVERAKFYILTADLLPFIEHRVEGKDLFDRSHVLLDSVPVQITLEDPSTLGPPRPEPTP